MNEIMNSTEIEEILLNPEDIKEIQKKAWIFTSILIVVIIPMIILFCFKFWLIGVISAVVAITPLVLSIQWWVRFFREKDGLKVAKKVKNKKVNFNLN